MSSRIEQLIDEIEDYIDGCKYQPLSKTNIIVNKEEIDELLRELRMKTPDEIKKVDISDIFSRLGLHEHLSPSRRNGLTAMTEKILHYADAF